MALVGVNTGGRFPRGYLRRCVASTIIQAGTAFTVAFRAYWRRQASLYGPDSLINRFPEQSTMRECGRERSNMDKKTRPVSGLTNDGNHHACCIKAVAAPISIPARTASPVSPGETAVHSVPVGFGWYCCRISLFFANPP